MKVSEYIHEYEQEANNILNGGIASVGRFLCHKDRANKLFRDEATAIYSFLKSPKIPGETEIVVGGEAQDFDARVGDVILEVVRALPTGDHLIRNSLAQGGKGEKSFQIRDEFTPMRLQALIVDAIKSKHAKHYADRRTLLVSINGEDSQEEDVLINEAIQGVRQETCIGNFSAIWLVESSRFTCYCIFPKPDA